jgi:hypothetical protein
VSGSAPEPATFASPPETDRPPLATNFSASPVDPPSSEEARAVVVEFFAALDDGDVDAAASLVCADYLEDELGSDLPRLATYSYEPPLFESEEEEGSRRELVVALTYSDSQETFNERLRISVRAASSALICGIAPA